MKYMMFGGVILSSFEYEDHLLLEDRGVNSFCGWYTLEEAKECVKNEGYEWAQLVEMRYGIPTVVWEYGYSSEWSGRIWQEVKEKV